MARLAIRRLPRALGSITSGVLVCLLLACQATDVAPVSLMAQSRTLSHAAARTYYVNCRTGSDRSAGTQHAPWATPGAVSVRSFAAGSTIRFARRCSWNTPLTLRGGGTSRRPILVAAYGRGVNPTFTSSSPNDLATIDVLGDFVTVKHLKVTGAAQYAIRAAGKSDTMADDTVTHSGGAVLVVGPGAIVNEMRARNLHMIVNTPGGDDDYGAVGYDVQAPDATVENSSCINCRAPSYDYGYDGGFVEIWNSGDHLSVHNNVAVNTEGFLEIGGGPRRRHANGVDVAHNKMLRVHGGICIHGRGQFAVPVSKVTISHNDIVNKGSKGSRGWGYVLGGTLKAVRFIDNHVRSDIDVAKTSPAVHYGNRFRMQDGAQVGF